MWFDVWPDAAIFFFIGVLVIGALETFTRVRHRLLVSIGCISAFVLIYFLSTFLLYPPLTEAIFMGICAVSAGLGVTCWPLLATVIGD